MNPSDLPAKPSASTPLPRDSRGSLEVFNPSTYRSTTPAYRPPPPTWQSFRRETPGDVQEPTADEPLPPSNNKFIPKSSSSGSITSAIRSSEDSGQGGGAGRDRAFPRVSEELKDALSTFQQTFVVSDATKPDYPILYASAGFFKMTGYTSEEVIGRNSHFLQGSGTNPEDVAKIRKCLEIGESYFGRLLNYKKDRTPLLTIAPIKDESGSILKFIGMQVEVSKHAEGAKDKMVRRNGLPESLIRYDAWQKEMATSCFGTCVGSKTTHRPTFRVSKQTTLFMRKSEGGGGATRPEVPGRRNSENVPPPRRNSRSSMH
ncbi:hypothetical protein IFM89_002004 [Coptis chinensis]|uniref:PAS domain-containing protein n=1 Tax=Coptis chinensis TaxID=261450 RepID=A0A835HIA1_9MAGN|nr:hypothetical protein IFM89_002004 [Coptis chinensis]